jgi:hypothetical protein
MAEPVEIDSSCISSIKEGKYQIKVVKSTPDTTNVHYSLQNTSKSCFSQECQPASRSISEPVERVECDSSMRIMADDFGYLQMKENGELELKPGDEGLLPDGPASFEVKSIQGPTPYEPAVITIQSIKYPQHYLTGHTVGAKPMTVNGINNHEVGSSFHWTATVNRKNKANKHTIYKLKLKIDQQAPNNTFFYIQHEGPSFKIGQQQPIDEFEFNSIH